MIVNVIEIFTEYLSVILCVHRIAKKQIKLDRYFWIFFLLNVFSVLFANKYREDYGFLLMIVYLNFFVYVKMCLHEKWTSAIKVFGTMLILIPSMQLIIYYFLKLVIYIFGLEQNNNAIGIVGNCLICVMMLFVRKEYLFYLAQKIIKSKGIIGILFFGAFFAYLLINYKQSDSLNKQLSFQAFAGIVGIGIVFILWINAENERRIKDKEIKLYELYNKTFEDTIEAIRIRQHEFDNHINAIKCLQYTIHDSNDLTNAQNEYCDKIMLENSFNRILKLHTEPILTGFLYSKFTQAKNQGIMVIHEVHSVKFKNREDISLVIEIIGILFDNAIDALSCVNDNEKLLLIKILQEDKGSVSIEVANKSRKFLNSEIEKFCEYGYSTKGSNRGIGLARVKEIIKERKADFYIENICYDGKNYLSFKIILL